jgi:lysophospholipase L1-like esterase
MLKYYVLRLSVALVMLFVTLEIGLQVASYVLPRFLLRSDDERGEAPGLTILCVGDSHTFGAPLPSEDAYPAQLKERLNAAHGNQRFRVVNLGIPGQNSAMVANRLEKQINFYRPDLIIAWVGLNNSWNFNEFDPDRAEDPFIQWRQWLLRSKVLRMIVVSGFREVGGRTTHVEVPQTDPTRLGGQQWDLGGEIVEIPGLPTEKDSLTQDSIQAQRRSDYSRIIKMAKAYDVPLIFLTYPLEGFENHRATNMVIRREAERDGVSVVAASDALRRAIGEGYKVPDLVVNAVGPHPTRILYRYLVDELAPTVDRVLAESRAGG